jgi:hypothetical protein
MQAVNMLFNRLRQAASALRQHRAMQKDFEPIEQELLDLQLSLKSLDKGPQTKQARTALVGRLTEIYAGALWFNPMLRAESKEPILFCISFPRSGVTRFMKELCKSRGADLFVANRSKPQIVFDKRIYPRNYPRVRVVKDHWPHRQYLHDDGYLLVRDGRDCMASLAWMTRERGLHKFFKRSEMSDFIHWTSKRYPLGSWARHTSSMLKLRSGGNKVVIRYEDAKTESTVHDLMASKREDTRRAWGLVDDDLTGSMFEAWQQSRGKSNWRASFDRAAAKAFHDTGGTEMLIELGYESDPDWWKQI